VRLVGLLRSLWRQELGQGLVLGVLTMIVILSLCALVLDVGMFLHEKQEIRKAVDAAALAASQKLPDSSSEAEADALEWLEKNGVDTSNGDSVDISFTCTSEYDIACNAAEGKWDTIVVRVERNVPLNFAPLMGLDNITVSASAGGCRGLCGAAISFEPVDVVTILDRTLSMTWYGSTKLANAKDGARALLEYFDPDLQHVGLGVLEASTSWANPCPGSSSSDVWLPVNLSDDYQNPDGTLNTSSRLVSTIDCLVASGYTDLGDPIKAATEELVTNGRPGEKWGIILLTDGAANVEPAYDTGLLNCTAQAAVTSGSGDNNGFETNPMGACTNSGSRAEDINSGTNTSTSCGSTGKDRHDFYNYGISVPGGNSIKGIEVRLDAWVSSSWSSPHMCVELSWDGGNTWTSAQQTSNLWTSQSTYTLGGNGDTWGRTWTSSELSDANFRVRVTDVASNTSRDFYLDWAAVTVYYGPPTSGPCDYAAEQGDAAKAAGIEVFTIGYGVDVPDPLGGDRCLKDTGVWAGRSAEELLEYIATDSDHFFNQPSGEDLRPIFQVIGSQMAGGSRLVQ